MKGYNGNFNTGQDGEFERYDDEAASLCGPNQDPSLVRFARKCINYGKMTTLSGEERMERSLKACNQQEIDEKIGRDWRENSSLEKWFPITAEQIQRQTEIIREFKARYHEMSNEIQKLKDQLNTKATQ